MNPLDILVMAFIAFVLGPLYWLKQKISAGFKKVKTTTVCVVEDCRCKLEKR